MEKTNASFQDDDNSPGMSSIAGLLQETDQIFAKASSEDTSSDGFARGIWGAFVFSLLGITALVVILILILRFACNRGKPTPKRPQNNTPANDFNNQVNSNSALKNTDAVPNSRPFPQSATTSYDYDNQAMTMDYYDGGDRTTSASLHPVQQEQYPSALANNNYRFNNNSSSFQQAGQHEQQASQDNFSFSPTQQTVPPPDYDPQFPAPDYDSQVPAPDYKPRFPPTTFTPGPMTPITPVPITPIYSQGKSQQESEYNPEYYEQKYEEPFQYLDNYSPYSDNQANDNDKANLDELGTKRAVLRNATPYQIIDERVQGEDYDDTNTFIHPTRNVLMQSPPPHSLLSSDSFNDGKTRKVRVLPPIHHHTPSSQPVQQQQQMGGSMAVFKPVAPVPPPPPPQLQQPVYAVPQRQF